MAVAVVIVGVCVLTFAFLVWPTLWDYKTEFHQTKSGNDMPIRVRFNRLTGVKETWLGEKWEAGSVIID